jgi:hypothetical protein
MESSLRNFIDFSSGKERNTKKDDDDRLRFLNSKLKEEGRSKYEYKFAKLEIRTRKEEKRLNKKNQNFSNSKLPREEKIRVLDRKLKEIEELKVDKERLEKYVIDGKAGYKFESNKVWFYTLFNVGGGSALLYMLL